MAEKPEDKKNAGDEEAAVEGGDAKKKKMLMFIIIGVVAVIVLGGGAFFIFKGKGSSDKATEEASGSGGEGEHGKGEAKSDGGKEGEHGAKSGEASKDKKGGEGKGEGKEGGEKKGEHGKEGKDGKEGESTEKKDHAATGEETGFGRTLLLRPFHLNLGNPIENHYIRLEVSLEYRGGQKQEDEIKARDPQLRDAIITVTSRKTREFLLSPDGKDRLRLEILNQINSLMTRPIENIYITDFIIE